MQEGRRKVSSDLTLDGKDGKQTLVEKNLVKGTQKTQMASIPACVTDSLSAIFYAASQPMVVGQEVRFPLADSMRTVTVTMKVEAKEEIKTPAGTFQTIRVQPTAEEGMVKNRGKIWIWYTDDARHMPVQIRATLYRFSGRSRFTCSRMMRSDFRRFEDSKIRRGGARWRCLREIRSLRRRRVW